MSAIFVSILKTGDKRFWLQLAKDGSGVSILGWHTLERGLRHFEGAYDAAHCRSYEASMSACINSIEFQPCVAEFESLEALERQILPPAEQRKVVFISSVSGGYHVLALDPAVAAPVWEKGHKPRLITLR